ncbi:MAG: hypothetical protein NZM43_06835 [Saprospiraceae bacterium]|nr:hypothetical protein [Saprospiraceae bacterium]MDW8484025.1 hypothetical protein [Saprospiraceae bacterium]
MRFLLRLCACFLIWITFQCESSEPSEPEEVVLLWQQYIDRNRFDSARLYSTELARSYVDFLDALVQDDSAEVTHTYLRNLRCVVIGDSAICSYEIEDELGEYLPDTLILKRVDGRWLVHRVEGFATPAADTLLPGEEELVFPPADTFPAKPQ